MKANYTPPKGVTQLTYNVSLKGITRLKALDERSKAIVRVKCGKQSDSNYKKWFMSSNKHIANFNYKGIHVYMEIKHIVKIFNQDFGICYKILAFTIKELPK